MIVSIILLWVKYGNNQIPIKRKRAGTFKGSIYSQFPGESTVGRDTQGKHWSRPQAEREGGTVGKHLLVVSVERKGRSKANRFRFDSLCLKVAPP